jgi:hypothetical protein
MRPGIGGAPEPDHRRWSRRGRTPQWPAGRTGSGVYARGRVFCDGGECSMNGSTGRRPPRGPGHDFVVARIRCVPDRREERSESMQPGRSESGAPESPAPAGEPAGSSAGETPGIVLFRKNCGRSGRRAAPKSVKISKLVNPRPLGFNALHQAGRVGSRHRSRLPKAEYSDMTG